MKGRYPKVKTSIISWRESNKQEYNNYLKAYMKRKYIMDKIKKEFLAILLE